MGQHKYGRLLLSRSLKVPVNVGVTVYENRFQDKTVAEKRAWGFYMV
jgi:hypothetical protein